MGVYFTAEKGEHTREEERWVNVSEDKSSVSKGTNCLKERVSDGRGGGDSCFFSRVLGTRSDDSRSSSRERSLALKEEKRYYFFPIFQTSIWALCGGEKSIQSGKKKKNTAIKTTAGSAGVTWA